MHPTSLAFPEAPTRRFARWRFAHGALTRGWWIVTSVYLVADAGLSPLQLVTVGTLQGLVVVVSEVPAGMLADRFGRRLSMVLAQICMGTAMAATALVTDFAPVAATQMLWGLSWALLSGADVAWLSDALADRSTVPQALARAARSSLLGAAVGVPALAGLAVLMSRSAAMVFAGIAVIALGVLVARTFREVRSERGQTDEGPAAEALGTSIRAPGSFRIAWATVRADRVALAVLGATLLVNGAEEPFGRLLALHAIGIGTPEALDATRWIAVLGWLPLLAGAGLLHVAHRLLADGASAMALSAVACLATTVGIATVAFAPSALWLLLGVLLARGVGEPLYRAAAAIALDGRTESAARATTHSLASLAENAGEISLGFAGGLLAQWMGVPTALVVAAVLAALAACWLARAASEPGEAG